jgi:hypothetical protein
MVRGAETGFTACHSASAGTLERIKRPVPGAFRGRPPEGGARTSRASIQVDVLGLLLVIFQPILHPKVSLQH